MPKITVTGQAQPQNEGSIPASHGSDAEDALAPGSRYVAPAQKTATGTSSVAVSNKPKDDGGLSSFHAGAGQERVPGTTDQGDVAGHARRAESVTASNNAIEPSA